MNLCKEMYVGVSGNVSLMFNAAADATGQEQPRKGPIKTFTNKQTLMFDIGFMLPFSAVVTPKSKD